MLHIDEVMYVEQKYIRVKFACCFRHSEIYQIDHTKIISAFISTVKIIINFINYTVEGHKYLDFSIKMKIQNISLYKSYNDFIQIQLA